MKLLFFKSHVDTYTRRDGTVVQAHEMTRHEFLAHHGYTPDDKKKWFSPEKTQKERDHWKHVGAAIDGGKKIPESVIADYKSTGAAPGWLRKKVEAINPQEKQKGKAGWEMSYSEFNNDVGGSKDDHKAAIQRAVAKGRQVPAHVLKEYGM